MCCVRRVATSRWAATSACRARPRAAFERPRPRRRVLVLPDRPRAEHRPDRRGDAEPSEDHLERHGAMENYAAIKERLVGSDAGTPSSESTTMATDLPAGEWPREFWRPAGAHEGRRRRSIGRRRCRIDLSLGGVGRCAAPTTPRTPTPPWRSPARSALRRGRSQAALRTFPGLAHRMEEIPDPRRDHLDQRFEGDQRRQRREGARLFRQGVLDPRRQAKDRRHRSARRFLSARSPGLSDRRSGGSLFGNARPA